MNQNEREGQSAGRTTGATGNQAEQQQDRTIEGQESEPGKVWQEGDKPRYTGQGDTSMANTSMGDRSTASTSVGGSDPRGGQDTGSAGIPGGYDETKTDEVNEQIDESQWQGNRFGQGGLGGNQGGSNG